MPRAADLARPTLSIVAPVYNEARILSDLVARCIAAGTVCGVPFELVLADDASTDDTSTVLAELVRTGPVRHCRLPSNVGQFRATQAGLRAANGVWVVVLDGDLQDPPEHIPRLVEGLSTAPPTVVAVLAVKSHRDDPLLFMVGQFVFHQLQHLLSRVTVPSGAGSYCVMRQAIAHRVAAADLPRANLGAVVALAASAVGGTIATVRYDKGARYDSSSRVGWYGLVTEALESLAITGALSRLLGLAAIVLGVLGLGLVGHPASGAVILVAGAVAAGMAWWVGRRARRALGAMCAPD